MFMKKLLLLITLISSVSLSAQFKVSSLKIPTNDLVYNPVTNKIYVTIPSSYGTNGNSIGIINPSNMTLEKTVFVGSEPSIMDISDNGQYIYVGFTGSATVRRFNVNTETAEIQFPLGSDSFSGPFYAYNIAVMPGSPNTIAVSRVVKGSTGFYGVAIYDTGVARANTTISTYPNNDSYVIRFANNTTMWGFNNHSTGYDFNKLTVDANGVKEGLNVGKIVNSFSVNDFVFNKNKTKVFFEYGDVVDLALSVPTATKSSTGNSDHFTDGTPYTLGTFPGATGRVTYDPVKDLACYATNSDSYNSTSPITFKRYNPNTFLLYDSQLISGYTGQVKHITFCGGGCYAFNTADNVFLLKDLTADVGSIYSSYSKINLFPNPATTQFTFKTEVSINRLQILDLSGKIIAEIQQPDNTINVSDIANGTYIVKCFDEQKVCYTGKFVKK